MSTPTSSSTRRGSWPSSAGWLPSTPSPPSMLAAPSPRSSRTCARRSSRSSRVWRRSAPTSQSPPKSLPCALHFPVRSRETLPQLSTALHFPLHDTPEGQRCFGCPAIRGGLQRFVDALAADDAVLVIAEQPLPVD